ncbi:MAG: hypothetical protein IJS67_03325 [Clostridia bacterium]|nr:hypothetical protein [Clostridia bacterium]
MSEYDYGKAAYLRLDEIEKRIAALESKKTENPYTEVDFSFKSYLSSGAFRTATVYADGEQTADIFTECADSLFSVTVNSVEVASNVSSFTGKIPLKDGKNLIRYDFASADGVAEVELKISGFIDNRLIARDLRAIGGQFYTYADEDAFYVFKVGTALPVVKLYGVASAAATFCANSVFVCIIDGSGALRVNRYTSGGTLAFTTVGTGAFRKCLVNVSGGVVRIYAVKGSYLHTGTMSAGGDISITRTAVRASDISLRTVDGTTYLLVKDIDGVVCLCAMNGLGTALTARYSAGKLENATISFSAGGVSVWYGKGGAVFEKYLSSGKFVLGGVVARADCAVKTDGGTIIELTGGEITV